jgi:hypothetical protein
MSSIFGDKPSPELTGTLNIAWGIREHVRGNKEVCGRGISASTVKLAYPGVMLKNN